MIYLDYAATAPTYNHIIKDIPEILKEYFYNPSARYYSAVKTKQFYEKQRKDIAALLSVNTDSLIFVSSATEAANTVIKGLNYKKRKKVLIWALEHPCVFEPVKHKEGIEVACINDNKGYVTFNDIVDLIDNNTALVCIMHINNETGAINDIEDISASIKAKDKNILIFSDMVQSFPKFSVNLDNIDFASFSSHKIGGLRGAAVLYAKNRDTLKPLIEGGGQEFNLRSGTENIIAAYSMSYAAKITRDLYSQRYKHLEILNYILRQHCVKCGYHINSPEKSAPYVFNFSTMKVPAEVLINALSNKNIFVASSSACNSGKGENRILRAMGLNDEITKTAIRVSIHPSTSKEDILFFLDEVDHSVKELTF
jgi:cysteine desulfurase